MTGLQALERAAPTPPLRPGQVEKRQVEDSRQETPALLAKLDRAPGPMMSPSVGPPRPAADVVAYIAQTRASDPAAHWTMVLAQLKPHQAPGVVCLVAQLGHLPAELGGQAKARLRKSMACRAACLRDPPLRIRFVYTPKHSAWLNHIQIWCSTLVRRLLNHACFASVEARRHRLLDVMAFFNRTAKP